MSAAARAFLALMLVAPAPHAAPDEPAGEQHWRIVASQSRVHFWVRLFGLVPLPGTFPSVDGAIHIDPAADRARVEADVAAASVRMRRASHTEWARSREFFDAAAHPTIRFESDPFPLARLRDGGAIQGRLTVRGVTRRTGFSIEHARCEGIATPLAIERSRRCRVELAGSIDRSAFGMRTRAGTLANRVGLRFHIEAAPGR